MNLFKKVFAGAVLVGCVIGGWLLTGSEQPLPARKRNQRPPLEAAHQDSTPEIFSGADDSDGEEVNPGPGTITETVKHSTREDFSFGRFNNTVVRRTLRLDADGKTAPTSADHPLITGTYVSGEEMTHRPFDRITFNYEATIPAGSFLQFEGRTVSPDGDWSKWRQIAAEELNHPIEVKASAAGWQYRFTFSAPSIAVSPEVESVLVITGRKNGVLTFDPSNGPKDFSQQHQNKKEKNHENLYAIPFFMCACACGVSIRL